MPRWLSMLFVFAAGLVVIPAMVYLYLAYGRPPVAVADNAFPFESRIVRVPLHVRLSREMPEEAKMPASPQNLIAGAEIYGGRCASCHGLTGHSSPLGNKMFPRAPQLWAVHRKTIVGVSDDPVGETYWKIRNGIRLSGMPSYQELLTDDEIWKVSILLSRADKPLPSPAVTLISTPLE